MPRKGSPYSGDYERQRKKLLAAHPVCQWCHQLPSQVADHNPPLGFHTHRNGSGCCVLVASCRRCNAGRGRGGWWVANQRAKMRAAGVPIPPTWREPPPRVPVRQPPPRRVAPGMIPIELDETDYPRRAPGIPRRPPPPRRPTPRIW